MAQRLDRRQFLAGAGALGIGLALAACSGPDTSAPAATAAARDIDLSGVKPAATIEFWSTHPGKSQDIEAQLIAKFHAAHPEIQVTLITAGADYEELAQRFQTAQAAKSALPAVVVLSDVWWFRYYLNGSIIPLDSVLKQLDFKLDDYRKTFVGDYRYADRQWAMPYARSTPLFYYNKDHFGKAGLPDRAPKTWEEFAGWAPKLASAGAQHAFMHPAVAGYGGWTGQNFLWGWGSGWSKDWDITCDSAEAVAAAQWMQDTVYAHHWAGVSSKDAADDFSAGIASATLASTGSLVGVLNTAKFDVGVGFLPGGPKATTGVSPTGGAGLGIPAGIPKEQQLAAATFIKFLGQPENAAAFAEATGYLPVRNSSDMSAVIAKRPQAKVAIDQLAVTRPQDFARVFLPGGDREMGKTFAAILTQQAKPKDQLSALRKTLEGIYARDVKPNLAS